MAQDHVGASSLQKHERRYLTRVGTALLPMHVLRGQEYLCVSDDPSDRRKDGEWGCHQDVHAIQVLNAVPYGFNQGSGFQQGQVHLPVTSN